MRLWTAKRSSRRVLPVKPNSMRKMLAESHVGAVSIAALVLWSLDDAFRALWGPISHLLYFLFTAIVILDIPYGSLLPDRFALVNSFFYALGAISAFLGAWLASRWIYGSGPLRALGRYRDILTRRSRA